MHDRVHATVDPPAPAPDHPPGHHRAVDDLVARQPDECQRVDDRPDRARGAFVDGSLDGVEQRSSVGGGLGDAVEHGQRRGDANGHPVARIVERLWITEQVGSIGRVGSEAADRPSQAAGPVVGHRCEQDGRTKAS
jgi:hypothetical protein